MAKEKPFDPEREARKAAKAAKKEAKLSDTNGVHKSKSDRKGGKEKKEKKEKQIEAEAADVEVTTKLLNTLEDTKPGTVAIKEDTGDLQIKVKSAPLLGALVPFANPLADEKVGKKVLRSVKKGMLLPAAFEKLTVSDCCGHTAAKNKSLKRGVKEVVKSLRKSQVSTDGAGEAPSVVVLAADISPMDVISHLPVLCEDHSVPYIFVPSRAELGAASSTKRPTSVVMVSKEAGGKKKPEEGAEDFTETYNDLVKIVTKAGRNVKI